MDQTLVLDGLIVTAIVSMAVIALAALALRRRSQGRGVRVPALGGIPAGVPTSSSTRPSTVDSALNPSVAEVPPYDSFGPPAPTSSTTFPAVPSQNDQARSNSPFPSEPARRWTLPPDSHPKAEPTINAPVRDHVRRETDGDAADEPLIDPATGFATRRAWDEVFRHEEHRFARYGRPVTLLVAELEGLDSLASLLGQDAADRLIQPVAAAMRRSARISDFLARTGHARFVALLPETDEMAAINYAERVCSACDTWLEAGRVGVHLALGWAQPIAGGRLSDAMRVADDRLNADRHRPSPRTPPSTAAPLSTDEGLLADEGNQGLREGGWTGGR